MTDHIFTSPLRSAQQFWQDQPLIARDLTIQRGDLLLSAALDFHLAAHQVLHVQGRNGAGKSTLLQMLAGLLPLSPLALLQWGEADSTMWPILYIGHKSGLSHTLSVRDNLVFLQRLNHADPAGITTALKIVGLAGYEDVPVSKLSSGQKRRVHLARLWLGCDQQLWLLDEPLTALDQQMTDLVSARIAEFAAAGGRVILTSHQPLSIATTLLDLEQHVLLAEDTAIAGAERVQEYPDA